MARKVKRVQYTWRVYWDILNGIPLAASQAAGAAGSVGTNIVDLVTAAELSDMSDNAKVKRVVGEVYFYFVAQDGSSALGEMAVTQSIVVADHTEAFTPIGSGDAQDVSWAWLRSWYGIGTFLSNEGGIAENHGGDANFMIAHIDAPINRRLSEGDSLQHALTANATQAAWYCNIRRNLRILLEV